MVMYLQVSVQDNGDVIALGQILGNVSKFENFLYSAEAVIDLYNGD